MHRRTSKSLSQRTGAAFESFTFATTKMIVSGPGSSGQVGSLLGSGEFGCKNVMVVADKGILGAGLDKSVSASLAGNSIASSIFSDIVADPPVDVIMNAVDAAKQQKVDGIVGLGGGSSMDVAKLVAFLAHPECNQPLDALYGVNQCQGRRLPLVQIPTTAGTGSEVTPISIVTTGPVTKKGIVSPTLLPDFAVLDAELTLGLPKHVTAATGVDAMVHAVEAFTTRLKKNHMSDTLAITAMRLLGPNQKTAWAEGSNVEARSAMLLGSCYAGMAFANAPVGAVHALAYPIGAQFHVPHGLSNSLVLPHVLRYNSELPHVKAMYDECHQHLFGSQGGSSSLADSFATLAEELELETQLRQVKITENDLKGLAEEAMQQTRLLPNNPRDVDFDAVFGIYRSAF